MKIAHIGLNVVPSTGGSYKAIVDFSQLCESIIISFTNQNIQIPDDSISSQEIHILTSPGFWGRTFSWAPKCNRINADKAILKTNLLVCHILWRYHVHWIKAHVKHNNFPYWVIPHGCLDPYVFSYRSLVKKIWFYLFGHSFLKKAAFVIFATEKEKLKASKYYDGNNCLVIHWPVQPVDIRRREFARNVIRHRHAINFDDKIIIFLGRLHHSKRPLETIASFAKAGVSDTHLFVVGPEETISHKECLNLIDTLGVCNVHILGPIYGEDKYDYLLAVDAYISLSEKENFGYTTAEALSARLPVILSPGNDLADELTSIECGWLLNDNKPEAAAVAIKEFVETSNYQLAKMGENGRKWALANLSYNIFADKVSQLVANTLLSKLL